MIIPFAGVIGSHITEYPDCSSRGLLIPIFNLQDIACGWGKNKVHYIKALSSLRKGMLNHHKG